MTFKIQDSLNYLHDYKCQNLVYNTIERRFSNILQEMSLFFANIHIIFFKNGSFFVNKRQYHRKTQTVTANMKQITAIIQLKDDFSTQLNPGIDGQVWRMNSLFNSNIIYIAVYYLFI